MIYQRISKLIVMGLIALPMVSCSDDNTDPVDNDNLKPNTEFGQKTGNFEASEWYPGGEKGTVNDRSYSTEAPAVTSQGLSANFNKGEDNFAKLYTFTENPRKGLGPAWVRSSCIHCHPSYGHGKRQDQYNAHTIGNGYLLVIYHPDAAYTEDGVRYTTSKSGYISEVTGMPQTQAMSPFTAPIDESKMGPIEWKEVTKMPSGLAMKFPKDGEAYNLQYPEINIPVDAFNTDPKPSNYEVRLESTIGIYGTGLLDAIDTEDMKKVYQEEAKHVELNPAMWDKANNDWASSAYYTLADGTKAIKKFTYAMTRASLQDGPGANAIWNITNVTRSDRHYLYITPAWGEYQANDPKVIAAIQKDGKSETSILHPYYADGTAEGIKARIKEIFGGKPNVSDKTAFEKYLWKGAPYNGEEEMSDKDYYDFMVWHRGVAVPAARDLNNTQVQQGKKLFMEWGCANCHKPSWKTGADNYWVDNAIKAYAQSIGKNPQDILPKFDNQTIYPYTDMVQHRLFMENDIRTGWCRTTPLWGRGLSRMLTGADDRMHDCRARNVVEAIMWHCYSKQSDAYSSAINFYNASKADRDAVVAFINAI